MNHPTPLSSFHLARTVWRTACRALASLQLAVALLVVLAGVLAWGTCLESVRGRELAQWYVYTSAWFMGLLGLLGANILAATLVRFPWKKDQIGFLLTHAGLLVLLCGAIQTCMFGIEGHVALRIGEETDSLVMNTRSQITVDRPSEHGRVSTTFAFRPGAVDWPAGDTLDFGPAQGLGLRVQGFYRHARPEVTWVADQQDYEGPALRLRLFQRNGDVIGEDWLAASIYGGESIIGNTMFVLLPVPLETMVEDFLRPPVENLGEAGILSVHYAGNSYRYPVDATLGKKIPLGDSGIEVEIVDYLPDARPARDGTFVSHSPSPKNPVLELRIHQPGEARPIRQLAFAKRPLLNLDAAYGRQCLVKFWYHHPDVRFAPGALFLQTPRGKLYCRAVVDGGHSRPREVQVGSTIALGGQLAVALVEHLPRARQQVDFVPLEPTGPHRQGPEAAVQVEVTVGGDRQLVWLQRADERYGYHSLLTPQGVVTFTFGYESRPLGFRVSLDESARGQNPRSAREAALVSTLRIVDPQSDVGGIRKVSMNQPLTYGRYTLYQSSFPPRSDGKEASLLTVTYDPGRLLKYLGSLMICVGIFTMLTLRARILWRVPVFRIRWRGTTAYSARTTEPTPPASDRAVPGPLVVPRRTRDSQRRAS